MSYIFNRTNVYNTDIINIIYRFNKVPDRKRNSRTNTIIKQVFVIREHLQTNHLTINKLLYSLFI